MYCNVCNKYRKSKKLKSFLLFRVSVVMNMKKYLEKKNQLKYEKFLV